MPVPEIPLLSYVGFGPGQELIPYFWALITFLAAALVAIVQWPIAKVRGFMRRSQAGASADQAGDSNVPSS